MNVKIKVTFYNVCDFVHVVCAIDVFGSTHPKHIARATWGECNSLLPSIGEYTSITIVHEWNLYTKNVTRENVFNKENDWNLTTVQTISLEVHELLYFQYLIEFLFVHVACHGYVLCNHSELFSYWIQAQRWTLFRWIRCNGKYLRKTLKYKIPKLLQTDIDPLHCLESIFPIH